MISKFDPFIPNIETFVGRDEFRATVIKQALSRRCVLLFGGRQSGKTSLLLKIEKDLSRQVSVQNLDAFVCPVYVDLTMLPVDAKTNDFFNHLIASAVSSCNKYIDGFDSTQLNFMSCNSVEDFANQVIDVKKHVGNIDLTVLFLIDETERVLGQRFPRGFQDNLFSILYGPDLAPALNMGMIFTGSQQLFIFSEDDTSPIGSRAGYLFLKNLHESDCREFVTKINQSYQVMIPQKFVPALFQLTGGHPGVLSRLSKFIEIEKIMDEDVLESSIDMFTSECRQLFNLWRANLSVQSRVLHDELYLNREIALVDIYDLFRKKSWDPILAEKSIDELVFSGVAMSECNKLSLVNDIYWQYVSKFISPNNVSPVIDEQNIEAISNMRHSVWQAIERAEIALREYVSKVYTHNFNNKVEEKMRLALGPGSIDKVISNVEKSNRRYRYSNRDAGVDIFDGLYLTQLGQLMMWSGAWTFFSYLFKDKRELENILGPIFAVRTDEAHFYSVPMRELERCKLHCEDLLYILEKNPLNI
ncbi:hypothetical protein QRD21_09355 [Klebsiella michiganensis]|uniref:hypothetical protein n=1 Tax=Klebsiella michiganensis TaxID=1134687 RepID=UPI002570B73F|nr:hypothetical protein [Klebsiella michiganensis]WJD77325.1 hypothetical protein QRD21_09355 [Klebsiella michiganensis]